MRSDSDEGRLRRLEALRRADSTETAGDLRGVRSYRVGDEVAEAEGYVLTADGLGGSAWGPGGGGGPAPSSFFAAVAYLGTTRELLGYWRLGESASPFADTSGHPGGACDAVEIGGPPALTKDVEGALPAADDDGAVLFPSSVGNSALLDAPDTGPPRRFNLEYDFTIAAWVKPSASASGFAGGVVGQWLNAGFGNAGYAFDLLWPSRALHLRRRSIGTPASGYDLTGPVIPAAEWTFVVGTYAIVSGVGYYKLYANGALVAAGSAAHFAIPTFNWGPYIGLTDGVFYGSIDEVTIWGVALTASEIATLAGSSDVMAGAASVIATSGDYTATVGDTVLASGNSTVTLPTAVGASGGKITVKNVGVGTITVAQAGTETTDGSATDTTLATTKQARRFMSDGVGWQIMEAYL